MQQIQIANVCKSRINYIARDIAFVNECKIAKNSGAIARLHVAELPLSSIDLSTVSGIQIFKGYFSEIEGSVGSHNH